MKVKELIELLSKENQDDEIIFLFGPKHESGKDSIVSEYIEVTGWDDGVHIKFGWDDTEEMLAYPDSEY